MTLLFLVSIFHTMGHTLILIQQLHVTSGIAGLIKTLDNASVEAFHNCVLQCEWAVTECSCSSMTLF